MGVERANKTELIQACRRAGLPVSHSFSRERLISILEGESPPSQQDRVADLRSAIMAFLIENKTILRAQITCPARSFEPDACDGCVELQPVFCLKSVGPSAATKISLKRKLCP